MRAAIFATALLLVATSAAADDTYDASAQAACRADVQCIAQRKEIACSMVSVRRDLVQQIAQERAHGRAADLRRLRMLENALTSLDEQLTIATFRYVSVANKVLVCR